MSVVAPSSQKENPVFGSVDLRVYQTWKGNNKFYLQGRLIFGPDVKMLLLTISIIVVPVAIFCVFVARPLMLFYPHNSGIAILVMVVVLTIFDLVLLFLICARDPGIIPRSEADRPEPYETNVKEVEVNGIPVKIKYCHTCMLYRPPRCSHCSICNNCVERSDHHCCWLGQCIGLRNYRLFFMFVLTSTILYVYIFVFCWINIKRIMNAEETTIWKAMIKTPPSIILIIVSFVTTWKATVNLCFHLYLISTNQTTRENYRYRHDGVRDAGEANPYNKGVVENFKEVFFSTIPPSKNNFRATIPREFPLPVPTSDAGERVPMMSRWGRTSSPNDK